jgi:hypothetical protein
MSALPAIPTQISAELFAAAQAAFAAVQEADVASNNAGTAALIKAMEAGDAAIALDEFAPKWGKQKFLKETTGARLSTIKVCMKLAQGRDRIEKELASASQMSIRGALRLLREPKEKTKRPPRLNPEAWNSADDEAKQQFYAAIDDSFLISLTNDQRRRLIADLTNKSTSDRAVSIAKRIVSGTLQKLREDTGAIP